MAVIINMTGKKHALNLDRAATVVNVTSLNEKCPENLMTFFKKDLAMLLSIFDLEMPSINAKRLHELVEFYGKPFDTKAEATFEYLKLEVEDSIPMYLKPASLDYQGLKDDRTYIVAGGTRGIGLKTVQWMASRGKKNLTSMMMTLFHQLLMLKAQYCIHHITYCIC